MQLRDYQLSAVNSCWEYISTRNGNPVIVLPTGAGKSLVLAQLAHDAATKWGGRVIILAHVKELLEQNRDKLKAISPDLDIG
jgi:DNA repair protein RadD